MAETTLPLARAQPEQARAAVAERFLTRRMVVALVAFGLFVVTFDHAKVQDDGTVYFDFLRRFFGVDTDGVAYQFGSSLWTAPFWLASQAVAVRGEIDHFQAGQVGVTVASNVAIFVTLYLGWRILRDLDLPRGPAVLLLALFGTPLWFYGVLEPSYKHAADTLYATAAFWFVLRSSRDDAGRRDYLVSGLCFALLLSTRYANVALVGGVVAVFWVLRLRRPAAWMISSTLVFAALIFAAPLVRHIPYASPAQPTYGLGPGSDGPAALTRPAIRLALDAPAGVYVPRTDFNATAPLKMLFTLHRGLFLWTPLTFLATVGFVLLLLRDGANRRFLAALGVSAVGLLLIHSLWGVAWDGYGSFSQRFLTALFPLFLLGTAELVRRWRWPAVGVMTLCACFSVWVGLVLLNGFYDVEHQSYVNRHSSLNQIVGAFAHLTGPRVSPYHAPPPHDSLENFGRRMGVEIRDRWQLYWRLVS
jgi:hypothetical protein